MMNSAFKQRGVGLVEFLLTLGLILGLVGISYPAYYNYQEDEKAKAYGNHIRGLIERIHQYQYYKITEEGVDAASEESWPATLDNLMTDYPERFWNSCTIAQEQNVECVRPDFVRWSNSRIRTYFYTSLEDIPSFNEHLVIHFPLHELDNDAKEWERWANVLINIPGASRVGNDIDITLRQATLALMYENIVMRDGSVTLTEDWDVGGAHGITNAKDYTIAASDGSQISVSKRLVTIENVSHGQTVRKPACSAGLSPKLTLNIGSIDTPFSHEQISGFKSYIDSQNLNEWTVGIDVSAKNVTTGAIDNEHFGTVTALIQCI